MVAFISMAVRLTTPVSELWKVGKVTAERLKNLGIENVLDLLLYYPFRYDDFSQTVLIKNLLPDTAVTVQGKITHIANKKSPRKRTSITEAVLQDKGGDTISCVWFNQPYLTQTIPTGTEIAISGTPEIGYHNNLQFTSPQYEKIFSQRNIHTGRLVPIYGSTSNLTQKQIRFLIQTAMEAVSEINEWIPDVICKEYTLIGRQEALKEIHFPTNAESLKIAEQRLKFEELFLLQLRAQHLRNQSKKLSAKKIAFKEKEIKKFVTSLPFELTQDQRKSAWTIIQECEKTTPMNRLLEGDVGSGKTVVAALAMLNCALNSAQAVLMAPTEIVARQHFQTFAELFSEKNNTNAPVALLTRSEHRLQLKNKTYSKQEVIDYIANGTAKIIIGTHALIQKSVSFSDIRLAIIDEQHRFGVEQRKTLKNKSSGAPHFLSMTATPIPRSLALTVYGDLDISVIKEMPKNRKPVKTTIVHPGDRASTYEFIRTNTKNGKQTFVICPLIEESDTLGVKSATEEYEKLSKHIFPECTVGLLHGKLKPIEKQKIQEKFASGSIDILVATSVVEVGVNVPNATIMMIEGSERFGLSQLHQFRGRVGRGKDQSYCFLLTESYSPETKNRLQALVQTHNGFELSQIDLEQRGPGDLYGNRQSGLPTLRIASLTDTQLIEQTQKAAQKLFQKDPSLQTFSKLKNLLEEFEKKVHLE